MIQLYNLDPELRSMITGTRGPRRQLHVCKVDAGNVDYLYDNLPGGTLFHTILDAMAVADSDNDIIVHPGQYIETGTIAFTAENQKLLAANPAPWGAMSRTEIRQSAAYDLMSANGAHNLEVSGFRLTFYGSNTYAAIRLASSATQYNTWIHNNNIYALAPGDGLAIVCGIDTSYATDTTYITENTFWKGGTKQITLGQGMRSVIRNNMFTQIGGAGKYGIYCPAMTAGVRNSFILDNKFFNAEGGACYGIYNNANVAVGDLMVDGNHFVGYTDADHCIRSSLDAQCEGANYHNHTLIVT